MISSVARVAALCFFAARSLCGQPTFEVASIKRAVNTRGIDMRTFPGGRLVATNVTLAQLVTAAYSVEEFQILGGPLWASTDRFDVAAISGSDFSQDPDRVKALGRDAPRMMMVMLQALLLERFQLRVHRETKIATVYSLLVGKNGPKLEPSARTDQRPYVRLLPTGSTVRMLGRQASMMLLAETLSWKLGAPVTDKTGLAGDFEFSFEYTGDDSQLDAGPSLFTAIQQLGLKLESSKGPVQALIIDHAERPAAN